ncbi:matrixin family metalloprotease [Lactobacillus sp. ESL0731]|uniref:matrixin family metalloprotease n=1 Tax=unclassified Lactobacillus TaxID=2620435 RepID=UPI0023F9577D|nr:MULTISPECIES: matrixin family metalloprotease [unclassified Lactobacillus]WEV51287.1 matrixin family metalloprotease [Lactobacillus sp. ESL0700]WEV62417.1 matrixin family metalloprotease [Lactobacillus sp. ESL0731]
MEKFLHFLRKLSCALVVVISLGSLYVSAISPVNTPSQVVLAKHPTRKTAKNSGKNCHWPKRTAKVYINLGNNPELTQATQDAISAWNDTGSFTFTQTSKKKQAQITIGPSFDPDTKATGLTGITYNPKTKQLYKAKIKLNVYYLLNPMYDYTYQRIINTVEHELGHAIGLNHNKGKSVMYPAGSIYPIEPQDVAKVKQIYHHR